MKVRCPYCNTDQEEPEEAHEEDELYMSECVECEKTFGVTPYYIKGYHEYKIPCENGEPHKWNPIIGWPKELLENKFRCEYCDEEKFIK